MRPTYYTATRRSRFTNYLLAGGGLLLLVVGGTLASLWVLGVNLNPFGSVKTEDPFMVRIPINAQPIPAYSRVERSQMLNPGTGGLMYQLLPPNSALGMSLVGIDEQGSHVEGRVEAVKNLRSEVVFVLADQREVRQSKTIELGGALLNVNSILGRVVRKDKRAGLGFSEGNFFPQGTPEGIAGATPEGMRAVTLDATKLTGVHALNAGDTLDLMASFPADTAVPTSNLVSPSGPSRGNEANNAEPVLLAQNAVVIKPVYVRNETSTSASLTQGTRVQNVPKYEVAIAVKPDDVVPLQRALNQSLAITCIAHSMKPTEAGNNGLANADSDQVKVPVTTRAIFAYDVVSRDAFVSVATRTLKMETISRQQVDRLEVITSLEDALGAIARHDIPAGRFLRKSDLLTGPPGSRVESQKPTSVSDSQSRLHAAAPQFVAAYQPPVENAPPSATAVGDRPAITRFVPPGMTAFAIPWNRLYGAEHLQIGDKIDLMASYSLESDDEQEETETRRDGTVVVRKSNSLSVRNTTRTWDESFGFRAEPWFVASDAIVIAPVGFPAPASAMRVLGEQLANRAPAVGAGRTSFSGPPVIVAVDDRDVEAITAALATRDALFTVAFHANEEAAGTLAPGTKQIVVTSEAIPPYQEFNESIWKGNRRRIATRIVSAADHRFDEAITADEVRSYYGRILGKPKMRGDFLTRSDFLPQGAKAGLASGARPGHTLFAVADREIEGLDSFETEDRVAILIRGVVKPPAGVTVAGLDLARPIASVIAQDVRIARSSLAGQTVLEIANSDLTSLQAAIARSLSDRDQERKRSHLVAVVQPHSGVAVDSTAAASPTIPGYDPLSSIQFTEVIVGNQRTVRAFSDSVNHEHGAGR